MRVFIIDAPALIALGSAAVALGNDFDELLAGMTTLAERGALVCPQLVVRECLEFGATDRITTWIRAASGHFRDISTPWEMTETVINECDGLFDPNETDENPQVDVLALALYRKSQGHKTKVVTGQWVDAPDRKALGNVTSQVNVKAMTVERFIRRVMA